MFTPIKVMDLELSDPPRSITSLEGYQFVQFLVRLHGAPLGYTQVPVIGGGCAAAAIGQAVLRQHGRAIMRHLVTDSLMTPSGSSVPDIIGILQTPHPAAAASMPLITVAVCTRDRTEVLRLCLEALNRLDYPKLDLIIIDNASSTNATQRMVSEHYPQMRYICEPRPGLSWARNRAIQEARGEIIAFTDDDVIVDPGWIKAFGAIFVENPEVMCVSGSVAPFEIETEAQALFERYGGHTAGFDRRWYRFNIRAGEPLASVYEDYGNFAAGANMAFRRDLFDRIGFFDPALGVGTIAIGGEDEEMFFRLLKGGYSLVYEPNAVVRHRHRRDYRELRKQIMGWGTGFVPYLQSSATRFPDECAAIIRFGLKWFFMRVCRVLIFSMFPNRMRDLFIAELVGPFKSPFLYARSRSFAAKITKTYGPPAYLAADNKFLPQAFAPHYQERTAVRSVDVAKPLQAIDDIAEYSAVRIFVYCRDLPLGAVKISHLGQPVGITRLCQVLVDQFGAGLLNPGGDRDADNLEAEAVAALERHLVYGGSKSRMKESVTLSDDYTVSIIIATYDRPADLRACIRSIMEQRSRRKKEIIVVDNNPSSGLTLPVMADFPQVILLNEPRPGTSCARNAGIRASTGDIIVTLDDDVVVPPGWLEKLLAPFVRDDVMVVTGNVLPLELETPAQRLFEVYGAFNRGYEPFVADRAWFESSKLRPIPVWRLGVTGNAAFRVSIFCHPQIGLFNEVLGPGTPTSSTEDLYMFYRVLKAGYTIIYEPSSYIFHKHRRTIPELRQQVYNYAKGHVAYQLTTVINDHDFRALVRLLIDLPLSRIKQVVGRFFIKREYPLSLVLLELTGNLAGPFALIRSRRRARLLGPSKPYVPVSDRTRRD
jgi:O-antigen biosynthesis protein